MIATAQIRIWRKIHTWTSLVCTVFLLMLAVTGLPLIFHDEIDALLVPAVEAAGQPAADGAADLDAVVAAAKAARPDLVIRYLIWDPDRPGVVVANMAKTIDAPRGQAHFVLIDEATARVLAPSAGRSGVMAFILKLHTDMFLGIGGSLFLGFMGILFVVSLVSGAVLYAPFMRKLDFGTIRSEKGRRVRWLDLHNLLGIVTLAWLVVVGITGVINTLDAVIFKYWRSDQLAAMVAPYKDKKLPASIGSVTQAMEVARTASPHRKPSFLAFPGTFFSSDHHYAVFMQGTTPLTSRILAPVLIDAETLQLTDRREPPWYVVALEVSRPLHFGDYGEWPLKIIWALFDLLTIVVIGSGLYLWIGRLRRPSPARPTRPAITGASSPVAGRS
jgi:uncharacterized iron-regulated membrane protein